MDRRLGAAAGLLLTVAAPLAVGEAWREDAEACLAGVAQYVMNAQLCSAAIERAPPATAPETRAALHARRGRVLSWLGEDEPALADYARALELNPLSALARIQRAELLRRRGRLEAALADLDGAVALSPRYAPGHRERGFTRFLRGETRRGLEDLDRALLLAPEDPEALAMRGIVRYAAGDWARARADLRRAEDLRYPYDYGVLWRGLCARRLGADGGAVAAAVLAELAPDEWPRAIVRYFAGETGPAAVIAAVEQASERRAERRAAFFYVGEWMLLHGAPGPARAMYRRALSGARARTAEARLAANRLAAPGAVGTRGG